MKRGALWKLSVSTDREAEDAVVHLLGEVFALPAVTHLNTRSGKTVTSVFSAAKREFTGAARTALREGLARVRGSGLKLGSGRVRVHKVRAEDWTQSWKRHFRPWEPGKALLVKPSWSRRKARRGQATMILDPGLSFGTGQHPTTRFCLKRLVRLRRREVPQSLLDIGTGTGILAIGASLLGYSPVAAFDFDPEAVRVARANARLNRVSRRVAIETADVTLLPARASVRYDVVCANLTHDLLISQRARIVHRVAAGGALILAGILTEQFAAVRSAFESQGWTLRRARTEGEWRSGLFMRAA
ncbi:MAG: 50S ribosomal protein L11 methyltransferase [Verrucomicrobia bacterium]|nr:50S ribosomal protein L11 methyltransferase [Verrucomicrobiota bacterium]